MAFSSTISVIDRATPWLADLQALLRPRSIAKVAGSAASSFVQAWFFKLNEERANKMGGQRTNFYSQAAKNTSFTSDDAGATVSVNQVGIRQRIEGGTIVPRPGKFYLTIPARAEAYGKRASEFNNLVVLYGRGGKPVALVEANATKLQRSRKGQVSSAGETGGIVYFWLVPKVVQAPDPSVFPDRTGLRNAVLVALKQQVDLRKARASSAPDNGGAR